MPLEAAPDAPPSWTAAAPLAGFEPGPCQAFPCATLGPTALTLRWSVDQTEVLAISGRDPEATLAIAASRLVLGPPVPVQAQAPDQAPAPAQAPVAAPSPVTAPSPGPAPAPPAARPTLAVVAAPAPPAAPAPDHLTRGPTPPAAVPPGATRAETEHARPAAPPPLPARPPVALSVVPPRLRARTWAQAGAGLSETVVLTAHAGRSLGSGWWGLGTTLEAALALELGLGLHHQWGRWGGRLGLWGGAELRPAQCMLCSVEQNVDANGTTSVERTGPFVGPPATAGWGPAGRATLAAHRRLRGPVALAAQIGVAGSARGVRPEAGLALFWTPG